MSKIGLPKSLATPITVTKPSTNDKRLLTWLSTFLGVALAMILIPFFLLFVNRIITLAWRQHRRSRDGGQMKDFHSWYNRIGLQNHVNHTHHRNRRWSVILSKLGIKHVATNYTAWFWAPRESRLVIVEERIDILPTGNPSPGWPSRLGSCLLRNTSRTSSNTDHELERGTFKYSLANSPNLQLDEDSYEMNRAQRCSSRHNDSIPTMSGALTVPCDLEHMSTVRRRHVTNGRPWFSHTENEDIDRANSEDFGIDICSRENERPKEKSHALPFAHRNESFATQLGRLRLIATRRTSSMPITSGLSKLRQDHQEPKDKCLSTQTVAIPKLYRSRGSCNLHVPTNSEVTSAFTPLCPVNSTSRTERSKSMSVLPASKRSYDHIPVDGFDDRLKWLVSRQEYDNSTSNGRQYCGTSGRSGSPVTAHAYELISPAMFLDDMSAYEAEGSLDGAVSLRESNTSIRMDMLHLSQYRKHWDNIPISHASSLSKSIPLLRGVHLLDNSTIRSSQSGFPTPKAKAPSATPTPTLKHIKRKRAVDRGIHVSMQKESENGQEELHSPQSILSSPVTDSGLEYHTRLLTKQNHDNKADSQAPSLLSSPSPQIESENPELLSKSRNGPALVQNEPTSTSLSLDQKESPSTAITDSFIQSLHTKLDRLHYELSPGFRSPAPAHWKIIDENVPIWSQGPHKLSMPSRRLKPRSPKGRSPRRSTIRLQTLPPAPTSSKPSLTFWRIRLNRLRSRARVDQLRALAPATTTTLPAETGIDTAAYILRQPPDGIGTDLAAATSLYLGAFGRARTLAHWQRGSDELTSRKRAPSQAALSAPPSKTLRRGAPMAKVRLKRDADVWCPEGFVRPADTTAGAADADAADADAADAAGQLDGGVEDGEVASGSGSGSRTADMEGSNEERAGIKVVVEGGEWGEGEGEWEVVVHVWGQERSGGSAENEGSGESWGSWGSLGSFWSGWSGDS